eukprot:10676897-Alexandrium_andersonii.AAC.1
MRTGSAATHCSKDGQCVRGRDDGQAAGPAGRRGAQHSCAGGTTASDATAASGGTARDGQRAPEQEGRRRRGEEGRRRRSGKGAGGA